jgi:magnesium-protoporphyrin O-methyltransferase
MFDARMARRSLKRHRRKGPDALEREMLGAAAGGDLAGARVLEIGGGLGTLQLELLEAGAAEGEIVELSPAWEPYARELAHEHGLDDRVSFRVADVLESTDSVHPADVVLMNRVVCCSPDGVRLTAVAADLARRTLVLSFPRERLLVRAGFSVLNGWLRIMRRSFRAYLHPRRSLIEAAEAAGLQRTASGRSFLWEFVALERPA